ncbi:MAG: imidazole glycerol phosphate synthase cyclase subunit [Candidatus Omnitrophica bacterium]|nr:imidazole glycerol phosphate synthase cyclase subunit [Candidatus Omnitrophota bacterium]MBU2265991.1 imidazole glycerol phosphate synthase cyclase subunit [Candidatus Omnitrophota bacterium]
MIRIIPRLDIKGPNLVKGVHLEGLRVLGKAEDFASKYYTDGADELIYIDVVASLYGRENLLEIVRRAAQNIFIPLTAGGGIRTIEDIRELLRAGADKVAINTAAIRNPIFISEAAKVFGSQCIVISIEAKFRSEGKYEALTDNGREKTEKDVFDWAQQAVSLGAGELLITSIDKEGTGRGYDLGLIKMISESVPVPVIACGGAGKTEHFLEVIETGHADAVSAASIFHYHCLERLRSAEKFTEEGNVEFISQNRESLDFMKKRLEPVDILTAKKYLSDSGIDCRAVEAFREVIKAEKI